MFSDHIKRLRLNAGYSQATLARKLGVTQGAVSQWESGKTRPDPDQLLQMAKMFDVPLDYFAGETPLKEIPGVVELRRNAVPIIGSIACGTPILADENIEGYADLPKGVVADFALRCQGDSMAPTFFDGDLVLVRKQSDVGDGRIAAVRIGEEATLKRIHHLPDGFILVPDNNAEYAPQILRGEETEDVEIMGAAVGFVRMMDGEGGRVR